MPYIPLVSSIMGTLIALAMVLIDRLSRPETEGLGERKLLLD